MQTTEAPVELVGVTFLGDWLGDQHRPLADAAREQARQYIEAIIAHDVLIRDLSREAQLGFASMLWKTFRESYDDLRGPYSRSEKEDVRRALGRI